MTRQKENLDKLQVRAAADGPSCQRIPKAQPSPDWSVATMVGIAFGREKYSRVFLEPNDSVCRIGDPQEFEALLAVDQADLDSIKSGQEVRIKLDAFSADVVNSQIEKPMKDISREPMKYTSQAMSVQAGGKIATRTDAARAPAPECHLSGECEICP